MSKLEDAIRNLSPEQRALLELRLKKKRGAEKAGTGAITERPDPTVFPISSGQNRLLALEQFSPGTARYNLTVALRLMGPLVPEALETSIGHILEKHSVLRGAFTFVEGTWTQHLCEIPENPLHKVDLSNLPATQRMKQARSLAERDLNQPFALSEGPLIRHTLVRLASNDYIFIVTMHHVVTDAWSFDIYFQQLSVLYDALVNEEQPDLPDPIIQYADFAHWQQQWLEGDASEKQKAFWETIFEEAPKPTRLPVDKRAPSMHSSAGDTASIILAEALTEKLKAVSLNDKLTPFSLFLSAFNALLFRYSGQREILVCAPVAGRKKVEVESLIGYFNNILIIKGKPTPELPFKEFAQQISEYTFSASDHQEIPFEVVAALPTLSRIPLTRSFFTFQNNLSHALSLTGLQIDPIDLNSPEADFDLALFVEQHNEGIVLKLEYKTAHFSREHIETILSNYVDVLEQLAENSDIPLGQFPDFPMPTLPALNVQPTPTPSPAPTTNGKADHVPDRNSTSQPLKTAPSQKSKQPVAAPADDIEEILTRIWERLLGIQNISIHDNFFDIGGHSLMAVNMFAEIQKYIGSLELPLAILLEAPTIASLAHKIRHKDENEWSPLIVIQPGRRSIPLFCIHGAGGNVLLYRDLAIQLGPDQTVYGLQSQGMDGLRPILGRIEDMAAVYARAIRETYPQGPYLLLGYCMGGTLAFEIAQQLKRQGHEVELVAMLETYNWIHEPKPTFLTKIRNVIQQIEFHIRNYFLLPRQERKLFMAEKKAELRRRTNVWKGRVGVRLKPKKLVEKQSAGINSRALAEVWRMNDIAAETYKPEEYPGRIMHFLPMKEYKSHTHPGMDWQGLAHEVDTHILSVYPAGMLIQPFVKELAQAIRAEIFKISQQQQEEQHVSTITARSNGVKQLPEKAVDS